MLSKTEAQSRHFFETQVSSVRRRGQLEFHLNSQGQEDPRLDHSQQVRYMSLFLATRYLPDSFRYTSPAGHTINVPKSQAIQLLDEAAQMHDINYGLRSTATEADGAVIFRKWLMKNFNCKPITSLMAAHAVLNTTLSGQVLESDLRQNIIIHNPLAVILAVADIVSVINPVTNIDKNPYFQNGLFMRESLHVPQGNMFKLASNSDTWIEGQSKFFTSQLATFKQWFRQNSTLRPRASDFSNYLDSLTPKTFLNPQNRDAWRQYLQDIRPRHK